MSDSGAHLTVAFVSAPGSSVFMEELLTGVGDAVAALGAPDVTVVSHHGLVSDVVERSTVAVVVPHEYAAVAPEEPDELLARTVAFGVEHPGTATFTASAKASARAGARFEISQRSLDALAEHGLDGTPFQLGHVPRWDRWGGQRVERDIDVAYLGTADPRRLGILAHSAQSLAGLRTELLAPPHEPMTGPRPDFLTGEDKWRLLARSKVLVNLHREDKAALEWVRVLEAIHNGCVMVTEPSTDLGPLRPGEHLLVATPTTSGSWRPPRSVTTRCGSGSPGRRTTCAGRSSTWATLRRPCWTSAGSSPLRPAPEHPEPVEHHVSGWTDGVAPMAVWLPAVDDGPEAPVMTPAPLERSRASAPTDDGCAAVVTELPGDGPAQVTMLSLATRAPGLVGHVGRTESDLGRGAARNRLLTQTNAAYVAVLDAGDELLGDTLVRDGGAASRRRRARRGALPRHPRLPSAGQRPAARGAPPARSGVPHPRLRRTTDDARRARRVHRGHRARPARRSPPVALARGRWRPDHHGPADRTLPVAALSPRLRQALLLAAAVATFLALGAVWLWRFRRGQPVDIDEAGYLSIAILDYRGLVDGGPTGYWDAVMAPSIQAPLMTALTAPVFVVTGTGDPVRAAGAAAPGRGACCWRPTVSATRSAAPGSAWLTLALTAGTPVVIGFSRSYNFAIASGAATARDAVGDRPLPHVRPDRLVGRGGRRHRAGRPVADA